LVVAAPFLASALILALGPFIALAVEDRLRSALVRWLDEDGLSASARERLISYHPDTVAKSAIWVVDAAGVVATLFPPILGLALLRTSRMIELVYLLAVVIVVAGFLWFLFRVPLDRYHTRGLWIFTPVPLVGVGASLIASVAAYLIGP
jgi:hypothetical protein